MTMERWRPGRGLAPWRPFRELEEMERNFSNFSWPLFPAVWRRMPALDMGWAPAIEVFEKKDKFVVKAELPGMKEEDIDVSVTGDILTIKGKREAEKEVKEEDYYLCERSYGGFSRSVALPSSVDAKKIEASYDDGVLEVSLPKAPEVKAKKVMVSAKKKEKTQGKAKGKASK
jgi:HSP20 family protein